MFKKFNILCVVILLLLVFTLPALAEEQQTELTIQSIYYDSSFQTISAELIDKENYTWVIDLTHIKSNKEPSEQLIKLLNKYLKDIKLLATYEDYNNKYLYDDEIIFWSVLN